MTTIEADANTTSDGTPCRRHRRAESGPDAVRYQLQQVADGLSLDAIVLADDLGRVLAQAGNPKLSHLLADSAMWAPQGFDEFTMEQVQNRYPDIADDDLVAENVKVPGADGTRLIAAGKSFALRVGVEHAISGIRRICTGWGSEGTGWQSEAANDELDQASVEIADSMSAHGAGVRWALSAR